MRNLVTPLLLALLTALLATACQKDEPTPPCRQDTALPRPHYPGNPYPLPYLPDDPTVVPTAYSVDTYLEPDTLVYTFQRNALGTEVFSPSMSRAATPEVGASPCPVAALRRPTRWPTSSKPACAAKTVSRAHIPSARKRC